MAKIMPTLKAMLDDGTIPIRGGVWIDIYNHTAKEDMAGVIHTRISQGNYWYVTEIKACDTEGRRQG
jgi:hypothetical protein